MKTVIYYFTGTGNSLAAARALCRELGDCALVPVASLGTGQEEIVPAADRVGIVCPVYFLGLPAIVAAFAARLNLSRTAYSFAVLTMGGAGGSAALRQLDRLIRQRSGHGLDAGFSVRMPGNYVLRYAPPDGPARDVILARADRRIAEIARAVDRGLTLRLPPSPFAALVHRLMYPRFVAQVQDRDRQFSADERCTACGTCVAVCPVGNIGLAGGRPVWKHRCELCCACIHLCPAHAIEAGPGTRSRGRYRHPAVAVADLEGQREDRLHSPGPLP